MTCKECIHENLCVIKACPDAFENTKWEKEPCDHFKPKSRFIELPCEVGQVVWVVEHSNWQHTEWKVTEAKVSMLQQKADKSWKIRISIRSSVYDVTLDEIGKTVFLAKEEAEKALQEKLK